MTYILAIVSFFVTAFTIGSLRSPGVHYPFSHKKIANLNYFHNENGARGYLYHGQTKKIAIIGSSTAYGLGVPLDKFWGQLLRLNLPYDMHVESFGRENLGDLDLIDVVENLASKGMHYDLVITINSFLVNRKMPYDNNTEAFYQRSFDDIFKRLSLWFDYKLQQSLLFHQDRVTDNSKTDFFFDPSFRQSNPGLFISHDSAITEKQQNQVFKNLKKYDKSLRKISTHQVYVTDFFAYAENLNPKMLAKYQAVKRIGKTDTYYDAPSLGKFFKNRREMNKNAVQSLGLNFFDWEPSLLPLVNSEENDIFIDEVHIGSRGSEIFAKAMAEHILQTIPKM